MKKMSETIQLEQLLNEKQGAEEESRELDEEQKQLKLKAKVLAEKIITELKKKNNQKQDAVSKLQSKVGELEAQLTTLSVSTIIGKPETPQNETNANVEETAETFNEPTEEMSADTVTVTEIEEEQMIDDSKQDKKKHKFF
jgi:hypothetical protein